MTPQVGGIVVEPSDTGWLLREADRPGAAGLLGRVVESTDGLRIEDVADGVPAGPYGSIDAAVEAVEAWRSRRFDGGAS